MRRIFRIEFAIAILITGDWGYVWFHGVRTTRRVDADVVVADSMFTSCRAERAGGGVGIASGTILLRNVSFVECLAPNAGECEGGGVAVYGGEFQAIDCWFRRCMAAAAGGAVFVLQGVAQLACFAVHSAMR